MSETGGSGMFDVPINWKRTSEPTTHHTKAAETIFGKMQESRQGPKVIEIGEPQSVEAHEEVATQTSQIVTPETSSIYRQIVEAAHNRGMETIFGEVELTSIDELAQFPEGPLRQRIYDKEVEKAKSLLTGILNNPRTAMDAYEMIKRNSGATLALRGATEEDRISKVKTLIDGLDSSSVVGILRTHVEEEKDKRERFNQQLDTLKNEFSETIAQLQQAGYVDLPQGQLPDRPIRTVIIDPLTGYSFFDGQGVYDRNTATAVISSATDSKDIKRTVFHEWNHHFGGVLIKEDPSEASLSVPQIIRQGTVNHESTNAALQERFDEASVEILAVLQTHLTEGGTTPQTKDELVQLIEGRKVSYRDEIEAVLRLPIDPKDITRTTMSNEWDVITVLDTNVGNDFVVKAKSEVSRSGVQGLTQVVHEYIPETTNLSDSANSTDTLERAPIHLQKNWEQTDVGQKLELKMPKTEETYISGTLVDLGNGNKQAEVDSVQVDSPGNKLGQTLLENFAEEMKQHGATVVSGEVQVPGALGTFKNAFGKENLTIQRSGTNGETVEISYDEAMQILNSPKNAEQHRPTVIVSSPIENKYSSTPANGNLDTVNAVLEVSSDLEPSATGKDTPASSSKALDEIDALLASLLDEPTSTPTEKIPPSPEPPPTQVRINRDYAPVPAARAPEAKPAHITGRIDQQPPPLPFTSPKPATETVRLKTEDVLKSTLKVQTGGEAKTKDLPIGQTVTAGGEDGYTGFFLLNNDRITSRGVIIPLENFGVTDKNHAQFGVHIYRDSKGGVRINYTNRKDEQKYIIQVIDEGTKHTVFPGQSGTWLKEGSQLIISTGSTYRENTGNVKIKIDKPVIDIAVGNQKDPDVGALSTQMDTSIKKRKEDNAKKAANKVEVARQRIEMEKEDNVRQERRRKRGFLGRLVDDLTESGPGAEYRVDLGEESPVKQKEQQRKSEPPKDGFITGYLKDRKATNEAWKNGGANTHEEMEINKARIAAGQEPIDFRAQYDKEQAQLKQERAAEKARIAAEYAELNAEHAAKKAAEAEALRIWIEMQNEERLRRKSASQNQVEWESPVDESKQQQWTLNVLTEKEAERPSYRTPDTSISPTSPASKLSTTENTMSSEPSDIVTSYGPDTQYQSEQNTYEPDIDTEEYYRQRENKLAREAAQSRAPATGTITIGGKSVEVNKGLAEAYDNYNSMTAREKWQLMIRIQDDYRDSHNGQQIWEA